MRETTSPSKIDPSPPGEAAISEHHEPAATRPTLLRNHHGGPAAVSYLELFFDLVYVFALTQISHLVLGHMTWQGLAEAAVTFAAIWWAWIYTTWAANWLNPERLAVRVVLILVMLASLAMAVVLPRAFEDAGLLFAGAYVAIQIGRTLFLTWALSRTEGESGRNMLRAAAWFVASAVFWLTGALAAEGAGRLAWWLAALTIEYAGPFALFYVPLLGSSTVQQWTISGHHMAERCALFIIIALGEGIVVTGTTFAGQDLARDNALAFVLAFAGSVMMWWVYFDVGAQRGAELIEHHAEPGRVARNAYTYLHMPIVVAMIAVAVADELLLAHPGGHTEKPLVAFLCGGLAIYLLGVGAFKRFANPFRKFPLSHLAGLGLFAALALWAWLAQPPALLFAAFAVAILVIVAAWEWGSLHGGWRERWQRRRHP